MNLLKQRLGRFGLGLGLAATMALGAVMPALADDGDVTVSGSTLDSTPGAVTSPVGNIQLSGVDQNADFTLGDWVVNDKRGTGQGWKLSMTMSQFIDSENNDRPFPAQTAASISAGLATATCFNAVVGSCSESSITNTVTPTGTVTMDDATPKALFDTGNNGGDGGVGMGKYTLHGGTLTVKIPASAYAGTYTSTITFDFATNIPDLP